MSAKFLILKNILAELKRKNSITVLEEYYQDKWEFYDLLMDLTNDENFKQAYIDNSFSKSFKKDFDHYTELANQAKKTVSKYFRNKDIDLRAFYAKTNNSDRVLNINLINYNRSEPIKISDILQQERDISTLNIYCDKKHDIYAYRKGKERHYEFKEGAYYEMTSTWSVQDKDGKTVTCTMVMNVSNSGITKVLQFNGKDFKSPPEEFWNLIRQNEELYIQGLSLHDAVKALLGKNKDAPAVINLQNNEHIVINNDEKMKDLENDPKSNPILSFTSNNVSEVNPQQIATQTEVNSQHTETQTEVSVQHVKTQTEIGSQETETQTKVNLQEAAIQTEIAVQHIETQTEIIPQQSEAQNLQEVATQIEVNLQHIETQAEVIVQHAETQTGIGSQETETQTEVNLQEATVQTEVNSQQLDQKFTKAEQEIRELNEQRNKLQYRLDEAKQEIEELEKRNSDLQNEFGEEKQKNAELQAGLTQKDEKLANMSTELQEKAQELEGAYEEKKKLKKELEVANVKNKKLEDTLQIESEQAERIMIEENERLTNLKYRLNKAEQEIEELEKHNSDLQDELRREKQKNAKLANISTELQERAQEFEGAYEEKKDLKKKLEIANAKNKKLEDTLQIESKQAERIMIEENERLMNLKYRLDKAEQELEELEKHNSDLQNELGEEKQEIRELNKQKNKLQYRLDEAEQEFEELEKHNSDLQDELGKEKQKNAKLQAELTQKNAKLANMSTELQERAQELEGAYEEKKDLKKKLEVANAGKEELISELRKLHEELNQLKEEKYSLEDKLDQLEHYSNSTKESSEQQISDLKEELLLLKEANQMLKAKQVESEQELVEAKQKIEELEEQCNDLQVECKEKEQRLEKEMSKTDERIIQLNKEQEQKIQEIYGKNKELEEKVEELKEKLKTANAEQEKRQDKLNQFEKKEEEIEEAEHMISARDKCIASYKSQIQNLENEHNAHLESDEQEADQLTWDFETLKNELELKDEQIETIRGQLRQEIEEEIVNKYRPSLELKFKEYEDEIERLIREKKELNDKVQYLNSQVELLSPVIDQVLVNKKEVFDNNSKMFYQLTEKIDDSEKKSRSLSFDSAFHSDHCNSLLDLISSPSKVCSQSQLASV